MKNLAAVLPSVMGNIFNNTPLCELVKLPQRREGNAAAKRDTARELRRQADLYDRAAPSVGGTVARHAAALLREIAAECDATALQIEREAQTTGAAA